MTDLAQQAFSTNNFDLAAQIYQRIISNDGPSVDLYLALGDSLAKGGNFTRAFDAYSNAFRMGGKKPVRLEKLNHLVSALVDEISRQDLIPKTKEELDMFSCWDCRALLQDPVTIPCGHTFCRKCVDKDTARTCKKCGIVHHYANFSKIKTNVLVLSLLERWFPDELRSVQLKAKGNKLFNQGNYQEAISIYSDAIRHAPFDHLLLSNRSFTYASLDQFQQALEDADLAIQLKPHWPKGYFRKAEALYGFGRFEESVIAYLQCLALDPTVTSARKALAKVLHKVLSPISAEEFKHSELQAARGNYNAMSSVLSGINSASAHQMAGPLISPELLMQLKASLRDTVTKKKLQHIVAECLCSVGAASEQHRQSAENSDEKTLHTSQKPRSNSITVEDQNTVPLSKCQSAPSLLQGSTDVEMEDAYKSKSLPTTFDEISDIRQNKKRTRLRSESSNSSVQNKHSKSEEITPERRERRVDESLLTIEDFECSLCYRTLYQPVSTPCGHTFCRHCLDRSLDHSSLCPLCKGSLVEYLAERRQVTTEAVELILLKYFGQQYEARRLIHEEEIANLARMVVDDHLEIPIFVCTLAFPSIPCPLHVFEPRYRLMIRQCMEAGTRQFGMCAYMGETEGDFSDIGCMLEVQDVQYFPDGRSIVATVGGRRFKVLSRDQREGYNTAKVEFLQEQRVHGEEAEELQKLHNKIYSEAKSWLDSLSSSQQLRIQQHFGAFPEPDTDIQSNPNGPAWLWWLLAILPLDPRAQLSIVAMTLQSERLQAIHRVLSFVKSKKR